MAHIYLQSAAFGNDKQNNNKYSKNIYPIDFNYNIHDNELHICKNQCSKNAVFNIDRQICNILRENTSVIDFSCKIQSKDFTNFPNVCQSYSHSESCALFAVSAYMSPPSAHWASVGTVVSVRRSCSGSGTRLNSDNITVHNPILKSSGVCNNNSSSISSDKKRRCGALQYLRYYQFRKTTINKDAELLNENRPTATLNGYFSSNKGKLQTSKSIFKKKTVTPLNIAQNPSTKSKGIIKSISLFFSKSNRSTKNDSSIAVKKETLEKHNNISSQQETRKNHSFESMLQREEIKFSSDTNKSFSYSNVKNSSTRSVDLMIVRTSPSEKSLSDSASVCSSEQQLSSQTCCYGNLNCRVNDSGWKTVVGNVCRSNSKDSAIANSTLSGYGIMVNLLLVNYFTIKTTGFPPM